MDIVDVLVAKALSPQGQIETYAALAQKAVTDAKAAVDDIESITEQTQANNEAASAALSDATDALSTLTNNVDTVIDTEIKKLQFAISESKSGSTSSKNFVITYPDNTKTTINGIAKYYGGLGNNEDGTMTQKAITAALSNIPTGGSGSGGSGGSINLGIQNEKNVVIVNETGGIVSSTVSIEDIINALIRMDSYEIPGTVGIEVDYNNRSIARIQDAINYSRGSDFDSYTMYGGRKRCNVANDGTITAFYGDANYKEDGSNGQVMVYQPKFYYSRVPKTLDNGTYGQIVRKEVITLSATPQAGFKLHPLFKLNGEEVDYVLLPAYDGCAYDVSESRYMLTDGGNVDFSQDMLSSISGAKPLSGANNNLTSANAEKLARNRGEGWHITNMAAESAIQLLEIVELGTLNGQNALEAGVVNINDSNYNCASLSGSTSSIGNGTGAATKTINEINGNYTNKTSAGERAITYRGMENPWGNIWRFVGGMNVRGNSTEAGGVPYICTNFNYDMDNITINYEDLGVYLSSSSGYISAFGYGKAKYDWVFIPVEVNGNSSIPVGDQSWSTQNLNGINNVMAGGGWKTRESAGIFTYGFDQVSNHVSRQVGARLMFIPTINNIYRANIQKWENAN